MRASRTPPFYPTKRRGSSLLRGNDFFSGTADRIGKSARAFAAEGEEIDRMIRHCLALLASLAALGAQQAPTAPEGSDFFEKKIRPLLVDHCLKCHGSSAPKPKGGLRLDSRAGVFRGGKSGPALVSGDPDRSLLIQAVRRSDP